MGSKTKICKHCNGSGKCSCYTCLYEYALKVFAEQLDMGKYMEHHIEHIAIEWEAIGWEVECSICYGEGEIVY